LTLLDAGEYIAALPKKEHDASEWQAAINGPNPLARAHRMGNFPRLFFHP
jgi:hypothetical protein